MSIGQKIKERRMSMGYTQEELGNLLGLQKSAVAKYENGRVVNIKRSVIDKMSEVLQCSPSYLMGWEEGSEENDCVATQFDKITELLNYYKALNEEGRCRLMEYASDLAEIPRYIKKAEA